MWRKLLAGTVAISMKSAKCSDPGSAMNDLPEYTWEEIRTHKTPGESVWIVMGKGVYDITRFVEMHPGGDKILLAAGSSADPFWNLYRIHKQEKVYDMLEGLRIGNLKPGEKLEAMNDPFSGDPTRSTHLIVHSEKAYNGELPNDLLTEKILTPNNEFFVRNHLPVPVVDENTYELELVLEEDKCTSFTLKDLKSKFPIVSVESSIQCAGNRRFEANQQGVTRGVEWRGGAIGNAVWTGVRLRDILKYLGEINPDYKHVQIEALDSDPNGPFGTSIPIDKAMDSDTILAFEMNGETLPRDHGFPVRLIVPGYVGVRNIKWVKRITLSASESPLTWHKRDYRLFSPNDSLTNVNFEEREPVYDMPVQSVICSPLDSTSFDSKNENVNFKGFAYSGGGRGIVRVELTTDHGESWIETQIEKRPQRLGRRWSWAFWNANIPASDIEKEVCVRAIDDAGHGQPESLKSIWNYRGLLTNSWHCIHLSRK